MNIIDKITEKKNDLSKKMMLLELDTRFNDLVVILKQKEIIIEQTFLNKPQKQDRDWQDYYASLCLFIEQDVAIVLKMYERHELDDLSIYDDSSKEISEQLLDKQAEIEAFIEKVNEEYHDEILTNYLHNKYHLIMDTYQLNLTDILKRNEISLKNNLTDNYQEPMPLTVYNNCTLVKQRCLDELNIELNDFINYINSLSENKKLIQEKEHNIETLLDILQNNHLLQEFDSIRDNYYESITHINSIDTRLGTLQKDYFQELDIFYKKLLTEEQIYHKQSKVDNYIKYLKETIFYQEKFSKLIEIKDYLEENPNLELENLLLNSYYRTIKFEVRFNNGTSILYEKLSNRHKLEIEKLFIKDLDNYRAVLTQKNCFKEFLTTNFSLELLTKFTKLVIEDTNAFIRLYHNDLAQDDEKEICEIDYQGKNRYFDINGEVLIRNTENGLYYVASRDGTVKEVSLITYNPKNNPFRGLKYSNGVIVFRHRGERIGHTWDASNMLNFEDCRLPGYIVEDAISIYPGSCMRLADYPSKEYGYYSDGLIKVTSNPHEAKEKVYFIDKYGNEQLFLKNKVYIGPYFADGYLTTVVRNKLGHAYVEYLNHQGKVCYRFRFNSDVIRNFQNGLLYIDAERKFVNDKFEQVFSDYEFQEIKNVQINEIHSMYFWCLKSKKDGSTYIYEDGKLIPMSKQEILDRALVQNYSLIKVGQELKFVRKNTPMINSIADIFRKHLNRNKPVLETNQQPEQKMINGPDIYRTVIDNNVNNEFEVSKFIKHYTR